MFILYHSNNLHVFKKFIAAILEKDPLNNIFESEIILTQSKGMSEWMQIELSKYSNISANIKFILPASFIWDIFMKILPDIKIDDSFTKLSMTWKFMSILPILYKKKKFKKINLYLKNFDIQKIFYFSSGMADLFDQYLVLRPEWINKWKNKKYFKNLGKDEFWQSYLWNYFINDLKKNKKSLWNRANIYEKCIKILKKSYNFNKIFPKRIFLCGISYIPYGYLKVLYYLSKHIDIYFLFKNPCIHFWEDIENYKTISNKFFNEIKNNNINKKKILFYFNEKIENPLLSSWGKTGKDTINILSKFKKIYEIKSFIKNNNKSLLGNIQNDILNLRNYSYFYKNKKTKKNKRKININDTSISINVCHSIQREVEVLQDKLLEILEKNSNINPKDIIVMVSNIENYSPFIQSIFGNKLLNRYIPFSISNNKSYINNSSLQEFFNLIKLFHSRFTSKDILNFLEGKEIQKKFRINRKKIKIISNWIKNSGIRWGLDKKNIDFFKFPIKNKHTWKNGLNKTLLGYSMEKKDGFWNKIFPCNESKENINYIINNVYKIINLLCFWRKNVSKEKKLNSWKKYVSNIIKDFFIIDEKNEFILLSLNKQWDKIIKSGLNAKFVEKIPVSILEIELFNFFKNKKIKQNFVYGKINFCTLMPMRSIPFKIICFLGMNEKEYPRSLVPLEFDLISKNSRIGDRNRKNDDCYLFLEAILSAKKYIYISFIGYSSKDNTSKNPSILITELDKYINQNFYMDGDNQHSNKKTIKLIKLHIWNFHNKFIFSPENYLINNKNKSFCNEWVKLLNNNKKIKFNNINNLKIKNIKNIFYRDLKNFYTNSIYFWFKNKLNICYEKNKKKLEIIETFDINKYHNNKIRNKILNYILYKKDINYLYNNLNESGKIPYNSFGKIYWNEQLKELNFLSKKIKIFLKKNIFLNIKLKINKIKLQGNLINTQDNGIIRWKTQKLSIKDGFLLFLDHLIYCAMGNTGKSHIFGIKDHWYCENISKEKSIKYLNHLINGYIKGLNKPIILINSHSKKVINYLFKLNKKNMYNDKKKNEVNNIFFNEINKYIYLYNIKKDMYIKNIIYYIKNNYKNVVLNFKKNYFTFPFIKNLIKIDKNFKN